MQFLTVSALLLAAALSLDIVAAQFPSVCIPNILSNKECCPDACGGSARGSCENIVYDLEESGDRQGDLDRINWPTVFFTRACQCKGNYWGYKCQDCRPGFRGADCSEAYTVTRKSLMSLSSEELATFQTALNLAYETTSDYKIMRMVRRDITADNIDEAFVDVSIWHHLAWMHYYVSRRNVLEVDEETGEAVDPERETTKSDFAHEGPNFPPWHRFYLLSLEHELRKLSGVDEFALPYWDWIGLVNTCDVCTDAVMGGSDPNHVVTGFLSGWEALCYDFKADQLKGRLCDPTAGKLPLTRFTGDPALDDPLFLIPTLEEVEIALTARVWDREPNDYTITQNTWIKADCSFRGFLEGYTATSTEYPGDCDQGQGCGPSEERPIGVNDMHNRVHLFLGGAKDYATVDATMGTVEFASMDPMFFMHHNNVDRLYEIWIQRNGDDPAMYPTENLPIGQHLDSNMLPFFPTWPVSFTFRESIELGYTFEDLEDDFEWRPPQTCKRFGKGPWGKGHNRRDDAIKDFVRWLFDDSKKRA